MIQTKNQSKMQRKKNEFKKILKNQTDIYID
jgi:hypothetical protein